MSNTHRRALSLVEVLAVVGVILIVAAVLFPLLSSGKGSKRTGCLSRIKQIGLGMLTYTADNDDRFPASTHAAPGADWGPQIFPYVIRPLLYACPQDLTEPPRPQNWPQGAGYCPTRLYSYALNSNLPGGDAPAKVRSSLAHPERTVMLFEVAEAVGRILPQDRPIDAESPTGNTTNNSSLSHVPGRHPGQSYPDGINPDPNVLHALYATGNVGGRVLNGGQGSKPRHGSRAYYAAADGHAKGLGPAFVSGGADAVDPSCEQGTVRQSGKCEKQVPAMAAGTENPRYQMTFSSK